MEPRAIFNGTCISIQSITGHFDEFLAGMDRRERRDFEVAATILDTSLRRGRPPGGRSERVEGSRAGLFELRITPPGRRGPHTRALFIREGRALLMVRGLRKAQRGIPRREIALADRDALAYRSGADESDAGRPPRGSP